MERVELQEFLTIKYQTVRKEYALFLAGSEERVSPGFFSIVQVARWIMDNDQKLVALRHLSELIELKSDEMDSVISELRGGDGEEEN
jgi:hypothetical protein